MQAGFHSSSPVRNPLLVGKAAFGVSKSRRGADAKNSAQVPRRNILSAGPTQYFPHTIIRNVAGAHAAAEEE